jgi:hypothetical protein
MLAARIAPVVTIPKSGCPEDSSNTQPTAAIAATQEPASKTPLFGVTYTLPSMNERQRKINGTQPKLQTIPAEPLSWQIHS